MKKTLFLVVILMLFSSTVVFAAGLCVNHASITGNYSTVGGYPHYNITGTSTTKEIDAESNEVKTINATALLVRNGVNLSSGTASDQYTLEVKKTLNATEYDGANYELYTRGTVYYTDGTDDDATNYASKYFSVY